MLEDALKARADAALARLDARSAGSVAVVVNTGDANSYGIVINLGRCGIPVLAVASDKRNITLVSRYAVGILGPDHRRDESHFIDFLLYIAQSLRQRPVLFVNGDEQLMTILRHERELRRVYAMPFAPLEIAERLVNKTEFYPLLKEIGAPHAPAFFPRNGAELEEILPQLQYPCILKPAQSMTFSKRFGNKCLQARNADEVRDLYRRIAETETKIIVQQQILGTERYLVYVYFAAGSRPLAVCCYRKVRIYPTDFGNACVCVTVPEPEAVELCLSVLQRVGYTGIAEAEIQRDAADGRLKLVEINARTTVEDRLPERCGINMEAIAYRDVLGISSPEQCQVNEKMGVLWIDLYTDALAVLSREGYRAKGQLTIPAWLASLRGPRVFAFWAWDDPMPAMKRTLCILADLLPRLLPGSTRAGATQ